jgi:methylmalonyl-CoA mutase cobalamin-binding subunit
MYFGPSVTQDNRTVLPCQVFIQDFCWTKWRNILIIKETIITSQGKQIMKQAHYPIRAVAKLTGLSIDTLRAWERRYHVVAPMRGQHGRLYTTQDIEHLRLLREAVTQGYTISQVATHDDHQLRCLLQQPTAAALKSSEDPVPSPNNVCPEIHRILTAVTLFDYLTAEKELNRLATILPARDLIHQVAIPLMREVGERWYQGRLTIAQEHLASMVLRNLLATLMRLHNRNLGKVRVLLATLTQEQHEFGLLAAALLAASGGLGVIYLGIELPVNEIVTVAQQMTVQAVIVGLVGALNSCQGLAQLSSLSAELLPQVPIWVGGAKSATVIEAIKQTGAYFLADFATLEQKLIELGAVY